MLIRDCAGGVVFYENMVLMIKNDKAEWSFPKAIVHEDVEESKVAIESVRFLAGVRAYILDEAGDTAYEFYSRSLERPVANHIEWYVMTADSSETELNPDYGLADAKFFPVSEALEVVTYSQERKLLSVAYQKYLELSRSDA